MYILNWGTEHQCCCMSTHIPEPYAFVFACCLNIPGSWPCQDGAVQQAEGQGAAAPHRQDDGVQGSQDVALGVVGLKGLGQLAEGRHILHRGPATWMDGWMMETGSRWDIREKT